MTEQEDPRATGDICGVTVHTARFEFICVKPPHDPQYQRRGGYRETPGNDAHPERLGSPAARDRHYMVNRWPNRPILNEDT